MASGFAVGVDLRVVPKISGSDLRSAEPTDPKGCSAAIAYVLQRSSLGLRFECIVAAFSTAAVALSVSHAPPTLPG